MNLQAGQRIADRYEVVETIGESDDAELYAVKALDGGELLDLKRIRAVAARNAKQLENFRRYARVVRDLDHPNLIRILDVGDDDGLPYLVMERLRGPTLRTRVQQDGPFPLSRFAPVARQMLAALAFLHERSVIHRDVNAEAFLLDDSERLKLRDFGMAREVDGNQTMALPGGAPAHMAPEQLMGQALDLRADLYSVGAVFFELLSGRVPLEGLDVISRFTKPPPRVIDLAPETPQALDDLIASCLNPEPSKRPASAAAILAQLDLIAPPPPEAKPEPEAVVPPAPAEPEPVPQPLAEPEPVPEPAPQPAPQPAPDPEPRPDNVPNPKPIPEVEAAPPAPVAAAPVVPASEPKPAPRPFTPPAPAAAAPTPGAKRPGTLLRERMGSGPGRATPVVEALIRITQRLDALAREGAYHAPLSPATIRFDQDGEVLIDPAPRPQPGQTVIVDNPAYLSPECLFGPATEADAIARADIYSLGFVAFEWLVGADAYRARFPHDNTSEAKLQWMHWHGDSAQTLPRPADVVSWIPVPLSDLLQSMTAKSSGERPASYHQLIEKLEAILRRIDETRAVEAPGAYALEGGDETASQLPIRLILMVIGGLVFAVLLVWLLFVG